MDLEGRPHFVVPTVMITVGVFAGSEGPVYYPPKPLGDTVTAWNGRPVVVYHPDMRGGGAAGNPSVFNRQKVGTLFNARFDGHRLTAEAWIDKERVGRVDPRVLRAVVNRAVMEVSTGMLIDFGEVGGAYNGRAFRREALRIVPDHLAVLPDQTGACSVADGAGLVRNQWFESIALPGAY